MEGILSKIWIQEVLNREKKFKEEIKIRKKGDKNRKIKIKRDFTQKEILTTR